MRILTQQQTEVKETHDVTQPMQPSNTLVSFEDAIKTVKRKPRDKKGKLESKELSINLVVAKSASQNG